MFVLLKRLVLRHNVLVEPPGCGYCMEGDVGFDGTR